jgi:large subunit ribosomal protein L1
MEKEKKKKSSKKKWNSKHSRRYWESKEKVEAFKPYSLEDALPILKTMKPVKFDETIELTAHLGVNPKKADQIVRGSISLPKGIGKTLRVVAFCDGEMAKQATAAGAIEVGGEELAKKIQEGWLDFDVAIAHPGMMRFVGRLGKVLGPAGKMPSPKSGTVIDDVATAVREFAAGKIEFRTDAGGNVQVPVGKISFKNEDLKENIVYFLEHLKMLKPTSSKGDYFLNLVLSSTMSPGITLAYAI